MGTAALDLYLTIFIKDKQLNVYHVTILVAILLLARKQGRQKQVLVSRNKLMTLSHISTSPTFHKYFRELQDIGYIAYRPSYHPGIRSEVDLLKVS